MTRPDNTLGLLVFTDLDGSLLDHHTYRFDAALPQLDRLAELGVPVIPVSSKTRAEIEDLRHQLGSTAPFVVENGAAVFMPKGCFRSRPEGVEDRDGFWVKSWAPPRDQWLSLLSSLAPRFAGEFDTFAGAGPAGIAQMTGLDEAAAVRAGDREFSESVKWRSGVARKRQFVDALQEAGATVTQGGRFLSVSGPCDKGAALRWLKERYAMEWQQDTIQDLAIGDSKNDIPMLEAAGRCLIVRSPAHDPPRLQRTQGVNLSKAIGPAGWAQGVEAWLRECLEAGD